MTSEDGLLDPDVYRTYDAAKDGAAFARIFPGILESAVIRVAARSDPIARVGVVILGQPQVLPNYTRGDRSRIIRGDYESTLDRLFAFTLSGIQRQNGVRMGPVIALVPKGASSSMEGRIRDAGVEFVRLESDTNYAQALNMGVVALRSRADVMALTVAGAEYATSEALKGAALRLEDQSMGTVREVTGLRLPGYQAHLDEVHRFCWTALSMYASTFRTRASPLRNMPIEHAAFWRVQDVLTQPFDERYGTGGADRAWGRTLSPAQRILETAATVTYTQGLDGASIVEIEQDWRLFSGPHSYIRPDSLQ